MEEICLRVMNPHQLNIPPKEWKKCKYYPYKMSEKTVYENNGNWPNSHGMYLSTAGWMDEEAKKINHFCQPAYPLKS